MHMEQYFWGQKNGYMHAYGAVVHYWGQKKLIHTLHPLHIGAALLGANKEYMHAYGAALLGAKKNNIYIMHAYGAPLEIE